MGQLVQTIQKIEHHMHSNEWKLSHQYSTIQKGYFEI